jgi:hypothetical protein
VSDVTQARIDPAVLHRVAGDHDTVADVIEEARAAGPDIAAAVSTYGAIMYQVKAAVSEVVQARDTALSEHRDTHRALADNLRLQATKYVAVDDANADRLRLDR